MIVGNGDIATALKESMRAADDSFIFFASGVSNSREKSDMAYRREYDLLMQQDRSKHLVYFSSLSVFYSDTTYADWKRQVEGIIKQEFNLYTIIRLGNITWGDNPNTIINFIRHRIKNNEPFDVEDTYRYIIDKDEFLHWIEMIPEWSCEMNITGNRMKVAEIINKYGYLDTNS